MAIQLVHTFGRQAGGERRLDQDTVRFGRAPDNDVVFDAEDDRIASIHHAEIRREGTTWVLVDLASKNGTWVEGRRIDRHALESGDEIMFGSHGPRVRVVLERDDLAVFAPPPARPFGDAPPPSTIAPATPNASSSPPAPPPPSPSAPSSSSIAADAILPSALSTAPMPYASSGAPPPQASALATDSMPATASMTSVVPKPAPSQSQSGPVSGPFPQAPPAGARPGRRTIDEMISAAFRSVPRSQLSAEAAAAHRTRSVILYGLLATALVSIAVLVVWQVRSQRAINKLSDDLASVPHPPPPKGSAASTATRDASFSRRIYDANRKGIFMLASDGHGFCTAFAVRPSILATNAHCVKGAQRQQGPITALENEGRGKTSFRVVNMKAHPGFHEQRRETITPDVGLIYIAGKVQTVLELATPAELAKTGAGDEVYLIGFPGRLMNAQNPAATFMAAHVGRITDAQGQPSNFAHAWLVEHDAQTTGGTSGSPVFDGHGKVIAINAGTYVQQDGAEGSQVSPYKYAMRIDLLNSLLQ